MDVLPLASGQGDIDESPVVEDALLCSALFADTSLRIYPLVTEFALNALGASLACRRRAQPLVSET
jgi:hypothetical protein